MYFLSVAYNEILGYGQATEMDMMAFGFFKFFSMRNFKKC